MFLPILKNKHSIARLVFDPNYPDIDQYIMNQYWTKFYRNGKEEVVPDNAPEPLGKEFIMCANVDVGHTGN